MIQHKVSLIVASTNDGGIAFGKEIPWYIPEDLKKFKEITTRCSSPGKQNAIIMGRNTWESLRMRLPNRLNVVITRDYNYKIKDPGVVIVHSILSALMYCEMQPYIENIFIIGGAELYNAFLQTDTYRNFIDRIYLSVVFFNHDTNVDKFIDMRKIYKHFVLVKDYSYENHAKKRLFASYICIPKKQLYQDTA